MLAPVPGFKLLWRGKRCLVLATLGVTLSTSFTLVSGMTQMASGQQQSNGAAPASSQALTIKADIQQVNANTGVATARGNVRLIYPARGIQATAAQAQYFSRERRIVLSGNVYVVQAGGNQLKADTVTYLMDEDRFVALPANSTQVESVIVIRDRNPATPAP